MAAGGCNIQFAVDPATGEQLVIEMNPRVSRSSALASKATGFPDRPDRRQGGRGLPARRAAQRHHQGHAGVVRAGARLRRGQDPALRVREVPDRRPHAHDPDEVGRRGDGHRAHLQGGVPEGAPRPRGRPDRLGRSAPRRRTTGCRTSRSRRALAALRTPTPERIFQIKRAFQLGASVEAVAERSRIDPWFLHQMRELLEAERDWKAGGTGAGDDERRASAAADEAAGVLGPPARRSPGRGRGDRSARERHRLGIRPAYKTVDTCAGEFPSSTPYLYSSYDEENEARASGERTVVILGSGPNRIGQGVEFDYCCVRAAMAFRELGLPHGDGELEPGDGLHRLRHLRRALLRAAHARGRARDRRAWSSRSASSCSSAGRRRSGWRAGSSARGCTILGTSPEAIDLAEDRGRFEALTRELGVAQPPSGVAFSVEEAVGRGGPGGLSGAGAALLRARRPRHGDRLRRCLAPALLRTARRAWRPSIRS